VLGIEPGTSGSVARNSGHQNTEAAPHETKQKRQRRLDSVIIIIIIIIIIPLLLLLLMHLDREELLNCCNEGRILRFAKPGKYKTLGTVLEIHSR
jgi:hypothetical protein